MTQITALKTTDSSSQQLRSFVERIEYLEEKKAEVTHEIREIFAEAKGQGFDTKALREVLKLRKMKNEDRTALEELVDLYKHHIGMI